DTQGVQTKIILIVDETAFRVFFERFEVFSLRQQNAVFEQERGRGGIGNVMRVDLHTLADGRLGDGGNQLRRAGAFQQTGDQVASQFYIANADFVQPQQGRRLLGETPNADMAA